MMEAVISFFSVDNVLVTVWGYPISWVELLGTLFNLACVILAAKKKILTWPIGLVGVALFAMLFYQFQLYADFMLNATFYVATGIIGWVAWARQRSDKKRSEIDKVKALSALKRIVLLVVLAVAYVGASLFFVNCNELLPALFPEPTSYPWIDSLILVGSVAAQVLMMLRYKENWLLWIGVDVIATGLYWQKDIMLLSIEYFVFLINAIYGYIKWRGAQKGGQNVKASGSGVRKVLPVSRRA